jgi:hypothetical protein
MPRTADAAGKTNRLILEGRPDQAIEIRTFKEIAARNGLSISEILFEKAVIPFLHEHNWPPGNSQTVMTKYTTPSPKKCGVCGQENVHLLKVEYISGLVMPTCDSCLAKNRAKRRFSTVKRVLGVI